MEIETCYALIGELEIRQGGGSRTLVGRFPYGGLAVIADRGRTRKETISSRAFSFAIDNDVDRFGTPIRIDLLTGHDFGKPLASRQAGTLAIQDADDAVTFQAQLPALEESASWVEDTVKAVNAGQMVGLSPGFRVPPKGVVPNAESLRPEPGNPSVMIRQINDAVLREMSVVTSGAYLEALVEIRSANVVMFLPEAATLWL